MPAPSGPRWASRSAAAATRALAWPGSGPILATKPHKGASNRWRSNYMPERGAPRKRDLRRAVPRATLRPRDRRLEPRETRLTDPRRNDDEALSFLELLWAMDHGLNLVSKR